ncbi:MAG TPA: hypothetical protein VM686_12300, partial [Polyangiaceae bacterium]|nr:hypothetical protein [Polyangiaceae bacterium]
GRAIGGRVRGECVEPPQVVQMFCDPNEERDEERESGVAFMLGFQVGFGLGYPEPLPSKPATTP